MLESKKRGEQEKKENTLLKNIIKIIQLLFSLFCWIIGLILFYATIQSLIDGDDWGLSFAFITLPCGAMCFLFLYEAIMLTTMLKKEFSKKNNK